MVYKSLHLRQTRYVTHENKIIEQRRVYLNCTHTKCKSTIRFKFRKVSLQTWDYFFSLQYGRKLN